MRLFSRVASMAVVLLALVALALALRDAFTRGTTNSFDWVPLAESLINDLVFTALAVFFLWAMPERLERRTLLDLLHRLRSLAHVVDMHQLDKDPEQARSDYTPTSKSPQSRIMNAEDLHHYFDYCSELVSLIAKTAALVRRAHLRPGGAEHRQRDRDPGRADERQDLAEDLAATGALTGLRSS